MNQTQLIDQLWQVHNARLAITGLLQACETATDAGMLVQLHHLGQLLTLLDDLEEQAFDVIQNPRAIEKVA